MFHIWQFKTAYYKTRNTGTRNDGTRITRGTTEQRWNTGTGNNGTRNNSGIAGTPRNIREHKGQNSTGTRCRGFLVLEFRCRGFSVMESWCRSFLSSEKMSWNLDVVGICASTAPFPFSLNLLCYIINVDMSVVNYANYFVLVNFFWNKWVIRFFTGMMKEKMITVKTST